MRSVQDILAEMKPLMGSLDAEERKKLNALEEELKTLQMTTENKAAAKVWYEEGLGEIEKSITHIEHELKIRKKWPISCPSPTLLKTISVKAQHGYISA